MINSKIEQKRVIIIGGGVAGMNVIYELIKSEQPMEITCITKEHVCDYSTCGMPFVLEGVTKFEDIILHKPEFFEEKNVKLLKNTEVIDINITKNQIKIKNSQDENEELDFDFLVLATGRKAFKPQIQGLELRDVYTLMNYQDAEIVHNVMIPGKTAVVIGGGIIGLEMAVAFNENGISTTVVELAPGVLPTMLDPDQSKLVEDWLINKGIKILTGMMVQSIDGTDKVEGVTLNDGKKLPVELVLLSTGIKPNIQLASKAGLEIGPAHGIKTDPSQRVMKTGKKIDNIFALGDCVESNNRITGQPMISALASSAVIQARVIGQNILGNTLKIWGFVNPTVTMLGGLQIGSVGLTSFAAKKAGLEFKSATSFGKSKARYYPGWKNIYFKFLSKNGKLIGAQIVGEEDVKERINYIALAIHEEISIEIIINIERCFTPPLALLSDPMLKALNQLL